MNVALTPLADEVTKRFEELLGAAGATELASWRAQFRGESYRVNQSRDPYGRRPDGSPDLRWHLSISSMARPSHPPKWAALVAIAHAVRPGVPMVVGIPPRSQWMNVHPGVLHVVETRDANLIEQWRFEGGRGAPT